MPLPLRVTALCGLAGALASMACARDVPQYPAAFQPLARLGDGPLPSARPLLELPAYLRAAGDTGVWTLDTGRKAAVRLEFARATAPTARVGRRGRGPGEISVALAIDVSPGGVVWIADPGNGKVLGFRDGRVVSEFMVEHQPLGIAAPDDSSVWVGGDLMRSVMVRYTPVGVPLGRVGTPVRTGEVAFLRNQGVVAHGAGPCAVAWAFTFHPVVQCFARDGTLLWQAESPVRFKQPRDVNPYSMSPREPFAYTDVTVSNGRVYGLFLGRTADAGDGIRTDRVHVFDERDGRLLGEMRLPRMAKYFAIHDSLLIVLDDDPGPEVHVFRLDEGRASR